jgi:hypothetical protein
LRAFWAERALPSGLFGPRDLAPFLRLASERALFTGLRRAWARPWPGRPRAERRLHWTWLGSLLGR